MKLKAGVIGLGIGRFHLEALANHPGVEVTAVSDFDRGLLEQVRSDHPTIPKWSLNAGDVLSDPSIDLLVIASWDNFHHEQILAGIRSGKHTFVEKPLCQTEDQAVEISEALKQNPNIKICSNLLLRRYPRFRVMKDAVQTARIGQPYLLEGDYNYGRLDKITSGWRGQIPFYSVMAGGGLHLVDAFLWMMNEPIVEVSGFGTKSGSATSAKDSAGNNAEGFRFDDTVLAIARFRNGALAKFCANFACVYPHFHRVALYGTTGTIESLPEGMLLRSSREEQGTPLNLAPEYESQPGKPHKGAILLEFVDSILKGTKAPLSQGEILHALAVCFAIERACAATANVTVSNI